LRIVSPKYHRHAAASDFLFHAKAIRQAGQN
jgi:hypothetical protein